MNKRIWLIVFCFLLVCLAWLAFIHFSGLQKNGFSRVFIHTPLGSKPYMSFDNNATKINGVIGASDSIVFFRTESPTRIVTMNRNKLTIAQHQVLDSAFFEKTSGGNFCITGDSTYIYIFKINSTKFLEIDVPHKRCRERFMPSFAFTRCICNGSGNFIFRRYDDNKHDQIFSKVGTAIEDESRLSEIHHDWGMVTDGILLRNDRIAQFIYLYYKKNSYLVFDESLNLISRSRTIDTFTSSISHLTRISFKNKRSEIITENGPETISNISACICNGLLYVNSRLRADNETAEWVKRFSSIDVYRIADAKYLGSFNVPRYLGKQVRSIFILANSFIGVYPTSVRIYDFKPLEQ